MNYWFDICPALILIRDTNNNAYGAYHDTQIEPYHKNLGCVDSMFSFNMKTKRKYY